MENVWRVCDGVRFSQSQKDNIALKSQKVYNQIIYNQIIRRGGSTVHLVEHGVYLYGGREIRG